MGLEQVERAALLLGSSQTPDVLLRTLVNYSFNDAGADEAVLYTLEERSHELVPTLTVGLPEGSAAVVEPIPIGESACGRVAAWKAPVVITDMRTQGVSPRQRKTMEQLGTRALFDAPIFASDGHVLGTIEHHFHQPHRPNDVDLYRSSMYARLASAVIEHVRFRDQDDVREALAIRRRSEIAALAGDLLASSLDWQTTLDNAARVPLPALADLCIVSVAEEKRPRSLARVAAAHLDADKQEQLRGLLLATPPSSLERAVLESGHAELRSQLMHPSSAGVDPALRELFGVTSVLALPLVAGERALGVMTFCAADSERRFGAEELAIAEMLARRAAQAIEHARAYQRAQRGVRARDELLALASHDLKNLVASVKLNASFLLTGAPPDDRRGSRKQIESIGRVAERMNELVRDLLDSASIESGKLVIRRSRQRVRALLLDAASAMQALAAERGLALELELPSEELEVMCDPMRVYQVLTNLIGNAL
jgi:signal transduction histidine kinase